ncbi:probable ribonuclease ZC3H12D [Copidosoma floridanum]|uniref:probable ribonuclease ZC3H12D n=1 Tax=Copidosoma floridanum TaxID=29053 RepID=UPI000C6F788C|nr:probable ribonuclease ZC3H12D [Copidosoma floridanum]
MPPWLSGLPFRYRGCLYAQGPAKESLEMTISGKKYVECTVLGNGGGAEAEDSSYDSDFEPEADHPCPSSHRVAEHPPSTNDKPHPDVSRANSDTLAAEFAEYVTVHGSLTNGIAVDPALVTRYAARVEFGLKLGYTERLVQTALQKLGPEPGQNELLAELIKLGANTAPRLVDAPDESEPSLEHVGGEDGPCGSDESSEMVGSSHRLRPVVIDGSNVAMSHGNKEVFSCRGIKVCVEWFRARGHRQITVFVPKWRKEASRPDNPVADQEILGELERDRLLVFTPSRLVGGKRLVCYDDRYILRLASELDGIVVSNDNYRDLAQESPEFRRVVEERILMYSFVDDRFMPPDDPLGRTGPTLDNFLRMAPRRSEPAPPCPYAKKCTYGNKCKFRHPERGPHPHKSVTERLVEHARLLGARSASLSLPLAAPGQHSSLTKTRSWTPGACDSSTSAPSIAANQTKSCRADVPTMNVYPQNSPQGASLGWVAPRMSNPEPEPANMHRKLQRQLTLNPSCDPRIGQLRRYHHNQQMHHQLQPQQLLVGPSRSAALQSRQLTRHASHEAHPVSFSWEQRQFQRVHVTRMASAPDTARAAWLDIGAATVPTGRRLGASEPHLNLLGPSPMHHHPCHPDGDPQRMCAAVFAIFPKYRDFSG